MLSTEKAKFKSAFDKTKSQMNKDRQLKISPTHIQGTSINFMMKPNIFRRLVMLAPREFIAFFKNNWLIVSQELVKTIRNRIKNILIFILKLFHPL